MKIVSLIAVVFLSTAFSLAADSTGVVSEETATEDTSSSQVQPVTRTTTVDSSSPEATSEKTAAPLTEIRSSETTDSSDVSTETQQQSTATADSTKDVPSSESSNTTATIIDESEEELILDGGEESIIIPTENEKPATATVATDTDSSDTKQAMSADSSTSTDSTSESKKPKIPISSIPKNVKTSEPAPKLKIEQMKSINFAKNLKNYRSPKIAILLSLLFPGAGQAYAKNYLKSGIFGAVEIALITAGSIMGVKGSEQLDKAHNYADEHYSVSDFESYYNNMDNNLPAEDLAEIFLNESEVDTFYSDARKKNQQYYNFIGFTVSPYIHGWDDATPEFNEDFEPVSNSDDTTYFTDPQYRYLVNYTVNGDTATYEMQYGRSKNQETYNKKVSEANDSYRWSKNFFTLLIINHVASAIDAAITAKVYNDQLLGKSSFLNNINIREKIVSTPTEPANGIALEVRF